MQYTQKKLPKNCLEITFEVSEKELRPYLEAAGQRLSKNQNIPGFRPGHTPLLIVEKRVGAGRILEEALEPVVQHFYAQIIEKEQLATVGSPAIDLKKCAPGNPLVITATVALLPAVTELIDYRGLHCERKTITVSEGEVDQVLRDLQKMQTREERINRPLTATDKAIIDLAISRQGVPLEGGASQGHTVLMDEPYYIPGFTAGLLGMREGEQKTFTLTFPENHYQKTLAGKPADFAVTVKEIYDRKPPTLDDTFAQSLGKPTLIEVKKLLTDNLTKEKTQKEEQRLETELLQKIVAASQFENIPDLLVNEEVERMRQELEQAVAQQGLEWKEYLGQIKKSEADLKLSLAAQAIQRIKTTLAIRQIAKQEQVTVTDEEIDQELAAIASRYPNAEIQQKIFDPHHRSYLALVLKNRKVLSLLKTLALKN
ncbi:trigger factor [Candidatus Uhrbacteria bacterium]|nr:trigger factor [Candidatus Uhrbacteria bacterium]